jgi:hypothetical protein
MFAYNVNRGDHMKPNLITEEELAFVKSAMMFPIILDVLELDIKLLMDSKLKMQQVYAAQLSMLQGFVLADMKTIKREMSKRGIKIIEEGKVPTGYKATYMCRGYRGELSFLSSWIKSMATVRICEMMNVPISSLQN